MIFNDTTVECRRAVLRDEGRITLVPKDKTLIHIRVARARSRHGMAEYRDAAIAHMQINEPVFRQMEGCDD